jgi:uncharacterized protein (TIGR03435 family)
MGTNAVDLRVSRLMLAGIVAGALVFPQAALTQGNSAPTSQPAPAKPLVFEVASVKENKSTQGYGVRFTPDGLSASGVALKSILQAAYNQYNDQYWSGMPAWMESARFDIQAKFDPALFQNPTDDQRRAMLQALLAERFKIVIHTETRELPEYALVVIKGGTKLRDANPGTLMRDDKNQLYCRAGLTNFRQCTMFEFARDARIVGVDRIVVDRTGLTGRYDFELNYASPGSTAPPGADAPPDIYEALQDQLGLKLEPIRGPVPVFVVDHVERPSEN